MASAPGFEPGPHWWETSVLTIVPPLLPKCANGDLRFLHVTTQIIINSQHQFCRKYVLSNATTFTDINTKGLYKKSGESER